MNIVYRCLGFELVPCDVEMYNTTTCDIAYAQGR